MLEHTDLVVAEERAQYIANRAGYPLSHLPIQAVLNRYEKGETIEDIAKDYGVTAQAVYRGLTQNAGDLWTAYQAAHALKLFADAEEQLETATDSVEVARAREKCVNQKWKLERTLRRLYGDDKAQVPAVQVNILMDFSQDKK